MGRPDLWYRDLDINAALMPAKRRTLLYFNDFLYIADRAAADDMMSYSVADDEQCDLTKCPLFTLFPERCMPQRFHAYEGNDAMEVLTLQKQNRYNDTSIDLIRDKVVDRFLE